MRLNAFLITLLATATFTLAASLALSPNTRGALKLTPDRDGRLINRAPACGRAGLPECRQAPVSPVPVLELQWPMQISVDTSAKGARHAAQAAGPVTSKQLTNGERLRR